MSENFFFNMRPKDSCYGQMINLKTNSAGSKLSFNPFPNVSVHEHPHRYTPHLHSIQCDRYSSGFDRNRNSRFYFTKNLTPCRVYLSYNDKLTMGSADYLANEREKNSHANQNLNGRKLSAKTLKNQLKVSPQFIDDAKNFIFVKETMSLVPILPQIQQLNQPLTYAEMAVMPLNLPSLSKPSTNKSKQNSSNSQIKNGKSNLAKSGSPSTISFSESEK